MRKLVVALSTFSFVAVLLVQATAQSPGQGKKESGIVTAIMAFDKDKTGKVTKAQITDARLHRLFDTADANKDGVVTRDEITALAAKLDALISQPPGGKGGKDGPPKGGFGKGKDGKGKDGKGKDDKEGKGKDGKGKDDKEGKGKDGKGKDDKEGKGKDGKGKDGPPKDGEKGKDGKGFFGKGFPGGFGRGPGQPGQVLPPFLQEMLKLTPEQKTKLDALQKEIDGKLGAILTDEQKAQLKEMRDRGPGKGGFGFPGKGGPGKDGPKGPPPGKDAPKKKGEFLSRSIAEPSPIRHLTLIGAIER